VMGEPAKTQSFQATEDLSGPVACSAGDRPANAFWED